MQFSTPLAVLFFVQSPVAAQDNYLPEHRDISERYSTVICPNEAAGHTLLKNYYVPNPRPKTNGKDIKRFFVGLKATGCVQNGPVKKGGATIKRVLHRKTLKYWTESDTFILFEGTNAAGKQFIGVLDETGNNGFPRTELADWVNQWTFNGRLDARLAFENLQYVGIYRCDSPDQARRVVAAMQKASKNDNAQKQALDTAIAKQKCTAARDSYYVTRKFESATYDCGHECYDDWTALEGIDRSGLTVGLVFNASHF